MDNYAIEPKQPENTFYLCMDTYQVSRKFKTRTRRCRKFGGKIDKICWVLLTVAGTAVLFVLEKDVS